MAEIVNLRQARKRKARSDSQAQAAENRALFGRSKQQKDADKVVRQTEAKRLDGHRLSAGGVAKHDGTKGD